MATKIFTVVSPHPDDYNVSEAFILQYFRKHLDWKPFIVKEYGKDGDHPHLNIIWETFKHKKYISGEYTRKLTAELLSKCRKSNNRIIKNRFVFKEEGFRDVYLQKEKNATVIFDYSNYELTKTREILKSLIMDIGKIKKPEYGKPEFKKQWGIKKQIPINNMLGNIIKTNV